MQNNIQAKVADFNLKNNIKLPLHSRIFDLQSELGEFYKEILKTSDYGEKKVSTSDKMREEIGDIFYALLSLANELDIKVDKELDSVLSKYQIRLEKNKSMGNIDNS